MAMFAVHACQGEVDEYSSHGRAVQTGKPYNNRYVSVIRIHDRKVTHWRDYANPLVVLDAIGGIDPLIKSMNEGSQANEFQRRKRCRSHS